MTEDGEKTEGQLRQDYVAAALEALEAMVGDDEAYLGLALWGFSSEMAYPPHSQNLFTPGTPFVDAGEEAYLETAL